MSDIREVTAITRLSNERAILFGPNWNATIKCDPAFVKYIEDHVPGVLVDIVKGNPA